MLRAREGRGNVEGNLSARGNVEGLSRECRGRGNVEGMSRGCLVFVGSCMILCCLGQFKSFQHALLVRLTPTVFWEKPQR